jgi:hypothetical protein
VRAQLLAVSDALHRAAEADEWSAAQSVALFDVTTQLRYLCAHAARALQSVPAAEQPVIDR